MKGQSILLILSILGILILATLQMKTELILQGTVSSVEYGNGIIRINLEENKTLIIFTSEILNLEKGELLEFKANKGFSSNEGEILLDKLWKVK